MNLRNYELKNSLPLNITFCIEGGTFVSVCTCSFNLAMVLSIGRVTSNFCLLNITLKETVSSTSFCGRVAGVVSVSMEFSFVDVDSEKCH